MCHFGPGRWSDENGGVAGPITFAHRGARAVLPENTLPAFRRALDEGAAGLESDAWLAGDGEVVLVHNPVVKAGMVRLRVEREPAERLVRHGVPRLVELYRELGADYELSLDLKSPGAGPAVVEVARAHGDPGRLWLCAPHLDTLEGLRRDAPDVRLVHSQRRRRIEGPLERHAARLQDLGVDAMNMHHSEWTAGIVALFHRFDVRAFAWDTQEVRQLRAVLDMGIDAVYSDRPDRMVATVSEWTR
jgi:glycerophosphoryl diester phosphodiesterase